MATTICLIHLKGGCGKSSTCFHLAGAYAKARNRALIVENLHTHETIALLFDEAARFGEQSKTVCSTEIEHIGIYPTNHFLSQYNTPSPEQTGLSQFIVRDLLQNESPNFDIVLIDCPPNLYRCSWSAILAADHVIIPVSPVDFGTQ